MAQAAAAAAPAVPEAAPAASGKKKKLILIAAAALVVIGGAAGFFVFQSKPAHVEEKKAAPKGPALYVALDPPFVVNFQAERVVRYLQVTVQIMTRSPEMAELLKSNDPVIRNDLLLLFGNQPYDTISTVAGKEKLRASALETVRKIAAAEGGKTEEIEAVYFTSFVMQ